MARILSEQAQPDGNTVFTFDVDGVRRGQFTIPTIRRPGLAPEDLEAIAEMQATLGLLPPPPPGEVF